MHGERERQKHTARKSTDKRLTTKQTQTHVHKHAVRNTDLKREAKNNQRENTKAQ